MYKLNIQKFVITYNYFYELSTDTSLNPSIEPGMKITFDYSDTTGITYKATDIIQEVDFLNNTIFLENNHYYAESFNSISNVKVYKYPNPLNVLNIEEILKNLFGLSYWNKYQSYTSGNYVIYNNVLYKCISDTSGEWNSSNWEKSYIFKFN